MPDGKHFLEYPDFSSGYIAFWLPVVILAFFLWALLQLSSRTRFTHEILRSVAGFPALFLLPGFWIFGELPMAQYHSWVPLELFQRGAIIELAVAVFCTLRYAMGKWPITLSWTIMLVALHFVYWFYMQGVVLYAEGPIPFIVGFCSSLLWGAYLRSLRRDNSFVSG